MEGKQSNRERYVPAHCEKMPSMRCYTEVLRISEVSDCNRMPYTEMLH